MNAYVDWMKPLWQQRYAGINRANNALETIDNVKEWSSPDKKNQLLCEIYFLRAYYYFNLAQVFNGVPLVLSTEPQNLPRNTPDEVYAQIASDLKAAIEHVLKFKVVELKTDPQLMGALGAAEYARQKGLAKK